tara:strand:+ start:830 stop:1039 length:210 start_codon:yes stop_codon:yes gene_type:complete
MMIILTSLIIGQGFFVVITFLTFGEAQIIGGIFPTWLLFGLFYGAIGDFALTGKTAEMLGRKDKKELYA